MKKSRLFLSVYGSAVFFAGVHDPSNSPCFSPRERVWVFRDFSWLAPSCELRSRFEILGTKNFIASFFFFKSWCCNRALESHPRSRLFSMMTKLRFVCRNFFLWSSRETLSSALQLVETFFLWIFRVSDEVYSL